MDLPELKEPQSRESAIPRLKSGGGQIRTDDLEVMSLASYRPKLVTL